MKRCPHCGGFSDDEAATRCRHDGALLEVVRCADEDPAGRLVGAVVDGRFRVRSLVGRGGMGVVYRAVQTSVERHVALKVLGGDVSDEVTRRFMREARATSALANVHTVTLFDFGQTADGLLYLAMELLDGRSLKQHLASCGAFSWQRSLRIVAQIAESLEEAHQKGIIHRDLKPANVFLTRMGDDERFVKVLDFGIAKLQGEWGAKITGAGDVIGTPAYMSPEQGRGQALDARTDIYALGILLYELLTGRVPFAADDCVSLLLKHCQEPVPPLEVGVGELDVPAGVRELLDELLAKDREARIGSATAVRQRALALLAPASPHAARIPAAGVVREPVAARASPPAGAGGETVQRSADKAGSRRPGRAVVAAGLALVVGAIVAVGSSSGASRTDPGGGWVEAAALAPVAPVLPGSRPAIRATASAPVEPPRAAAATLEPSEPGAQPSAPERAAAPTVVTLKTTPVSGAKVYGPGWRQLGVTPLALPVSEVVRRVTIRHRGYEPRRVEIAAGARGEVPVVIKRRARKPRDPLADVPTPPGLLDPP